MVMPTTHDGSDGCSNHPGPNNFNSLSSPFQPARPIIDEGLI